MKVRISFRVKSINLIELAKDKDIIFSRVWENSSTFNFANTTFKINEDEISLSLKKFDEFNTIDEFLNRYKKSISPFSFSLNGEVILHRNIKEKMIHDIKEKIEKDRIINNFIVNYGTNINIEFSTSWEGKQHQLYVNLIIENLTLDKFLNLLKDLKKLKEKVDKMAFLETV